MPVNKKGGKGHKRGKKMGASQLSTALKYKDTNENEEYAKVLSTLGDCRLSVQMVGMDKDSKHFSKTSPLICKIPGSFRKKIFINKGDYILVSVRDFQEGRVDVITKYTSSEAKTLMRQGEIPMDDAITNSNDNANNGGTEVEWVTDEADKEKEAVDDEGIAATLKDENWYNSLLPPTSDDESEEHSAGAKAKTKTGSLNQRGLDLSKSQGQPSSKVGGKSGKKVTINLGITKDGTKISSPDDGEEKEVEEIDLEAL